MSFQSACRKFIFFALVIAITVCVKDAQSGTSINTSAPSGDTSKINTAGWADSPYVTPDGQTLYYMYSRYNFFPVFMGDKPPVLMGPAYAGHHNNDVNPYWDSDIYVSRRQSNGSWGAPQNMTGVNDDRDNCCAMIVAGPPTRIYFQKETPNNGLDIVYKERTSDGNWGDLVFLPTEVNSPANEDNVHVSADNRRFYVSSTRSGGEGDKDIWFSYIDDQGKMSESVNIGPMINTSDMEDQFWMSDKPDAQGVYEVYFNRGSSQIWRSTWDEKQGFTKPTLVNVGTDFAGEASVTADGKELYFASGDPTTQRVRIMMSRRAGNGIDWEKAQPID